jgi:FMN-dependent dehydrogenase
MHKDLPRRRFLRFLAGSPLLATPVLSSTISALLASDPGAALAQSYDVLRGTSRKLGPDKIIMSPGDALNVLEFEPAAKKALAAAPTHFGYLASGVDDDGTLRANREGFDRYTIRVRRLIDARKVDTRASRSSARRGRALSRSRP